MPATETQAGMVLLCDVSGIIRDVIQDSLGLARDAKGQPLQSLFDRSCHDKAAAFLQELIQRSAAFNWELTAEIGGRLQTLHFEGARSGASILVIGARSAYDFAQLCEDLGRVQNEQLNVFRAQLKDHVLALRNESRRQEETLAELARLNNEMMNLQRDLTKKNIELARLNDEKNRFLGMAAHDLRNPLSAIKTCSELLLQDSDAILTDRQRELLGMMQAASESMFHLVNSYLDLSHIQSGKLALERRPVDLLRLVEPNLSLNRLLADKKSIRLSLENPVSGLVVELDEQKFGQVLNNLVSNAIKFSFPGGQVVVRLDKQDGQAILSVRDQGQGIPVEEQKLLFNPFSRTSVRGTAGEKSTGLGLAITRKIVDGHGGRIWVQSEAGQGATFFVALPLHQRAAPAPALLPPRATLSTTTTPPRCVLVADDDPVNRRLSRFLLEKAGHRVLVAENGQQALAQLASAKVDLVLLDLEMPEMGGLETVALIRQADDGRGQRLPVLALTGHDDEACRQRCLEHGFDDCLVKPLKMEMLTAWLNASQQKAAAAVR